MTQLIRVATFFFEWVSKAISERKLANDKFTDGIGSAHWLQIGIWTGFLQVTISFGTPGVLRLILHEEHYAKRRKY